MPYLCVEHLVLHDVEVHCEEARLQGGAEGVALHQADLGVCRLVAEQVFLGGNHILQHLERKKHQENSQLMRFKRQFCISNSSFLLKIEKFSLIVARLMFRMK